MTYFDLHCDALSAAAPTVTNESLKKSGCALQCFAAFVPEGENRFLRASALMTQFDSLCSESGFHPVKNKGDLSASGIKALLSIEGGGAIEGSLNKMEEFFSRGVRLMTLTWNDPNELAFPNFLKGRTDFREKQKGLTDFGRAAVERMCDLGIAADVSHGSDRTLFDVAAVCKAKGKPFLASHSNAASVYPHPRNLEDEEIRLIADCGGAVGLNFCMDFLSDDHSREGQRKALLSHAAHILNVGGEDVLCLGSDFDGTEPNSYLPNPCFVPDFLKALAGKFSERLAEKIAVGNARRFLFETLPEQ